MMDIKVTLFRDHIISLHQARDYQHHHHQHKSSSKMQFKLLFIAGFAATTTLATPTIIRPGSPVMERAPVVTYNPKLPGKNGFTNLTCKLSQALTPGQPLQVFFPTTDQIGAILGPVLLKALGPAVVQDIDKIAEDLCV